MKSNYFITMHIKHLILVFGSCCDTDREMEKIPFNILKSIFSFRCHLFWYISYNIRIFGFITGNHSCPMCWRVFLWICFQCSDGKRFRCWATPWRYYHRNIQCYCNYAWIYWSCNCGNCNQKRGKFFSNTGI